MLLKDLNIGDYFVLNEKDIKNRNKTYIKYKKEDNYNYLALNLYQCENDNKDFITLNDNETVYEADLEYLREKTNIKIGKYSTNSSEIKRFITDRLDNYNIIYYISELYGSHIIKYEYDEFDEEMFLKDEFYFKKKYEPNNNAYTYYLVTKLKTKSAVPVFKEHLCIDYYFYTHSDKIFNSYKEALDYGYKNYKQTIELIPSKNYVSNWYGYDYLIEGFIIDKCTLDYDGKIDEIVDYDNQEIHCIDLTNMYQGE